MEAEFIRVTARVRPAFQSKKSKILHVRLRFWRECHAGWQSKPLCCEQIFEDLASRIIDGCVDGYNGTVFAYGQTGSGKTHTMFGPPNVENSLLDCHQRGLMPRACEALFKKLCTRAAENFTYEVFCRFVELYNEEFYDLLSSPQQKLSIRSDSKGVQLLGVSEHRVQSSVDMMRILEIGCDARRTAETAMNRESSRSHSIFIVDVKTEELVNTIVNKKCATLNLVDLAGSERQVQSKVFGDRFKEAISINLSLTVLGRVIRTLSDINRRDEHIPYRDSKLTHILRDSLGGNSRTAVIVNVHPEKGYYSDTLSTLQFAAACRKIENRVRANEDLAGGTIMAYKAEIAHLREELRSIEEKTRSGVLISSVHSNFKLTLYHRASRTEVESVSD
uniref:Kinesin-like protein n=1 Tax=Angiostrongylus cantonensis TaxID=6313 RepID=A0A0K0CW65_ANGCA